MRKVSFVLICAVFTSCVTVPYDTDNPRYILSRGASFGTSFIPGLTQLINGEYVKGTLIIAGTIGVTALSIAAGTGALNEMYRSDDSYTPEEGAFTFGALAFGGLAYSYIDGTVSTHKLNNQKDQRREASKTEQSKDPSVSAAYDNIDQIDLPDISSITIRMKESRDMEVIYLTNKTGENVTVVAFSYLNNKWEMVDSLNAKPYGSDRDTDDKYEDGRGIALALIKNEDSEIVFIKQDGNDVYFEVIKKK